MKLNKRLALLGTETAFSVSKEANAWRNNGNKVYPFHLGDINLNTPEYIRNVTSKYMNDNKNGYCPSEGVPILRDVLAEDVGRKRGVKYNIENVVVQPGGKPTIWKFLASIMNIGDEVLYPNPGYPIYESQISYQGGIPKPYSYKETKNGFNIDLEHLQSLITDKTVALIYNNYQNPLSASSSKKEMNQIAKLCIKHNLWVLSDDAYYEIRYSDTPPISLVSIPGMKERTVILYTFSKRFAMTGWRLGASIGPKKIIEQIARFNINDESCTNHFIQYALADTLQKADYVSQKILNELELRRNICVEALNSIKDVHISKPESTFYLFPNITSLMNNKGYDNLEKFRIDALHSTGVSFCSRNHFGTAFPKENQKYIRLAYSGINQSDIKEGMDLFKNWVEN